MERVLYSVLGNRQKLDGGAMFGNAPKALWERWAPADAQNRIDLACRGLLVNELQAGRSRWILFETGIGAFFSPELRGRYGVVEERHVLLDSLAARGVSHEAIDVVVLSHLHFDHAGGLLGAYRPDQPQELLFPRAKLVVGKQAWARAQSPHSRDRVSFIPELQRLLLDSGRLELAGEQGTAALGAGYRFHRSDGHTPGLLLTEIETSEGPVVFASDLVPGLPWVRGAITMGYDRFPELLIDEKRRLLEDVVARRGSLFFTHDPACAIARLDRDSKGQVVATHPQSNIPAMV